MFGLLGPNGAGKTLGFFFYSALSGGLGASVSQESEAQQFGTRSRARLAMSRLFHQQIPRLSQSYIFR